MPVESPADRLAFLTDFNESATYTPTVGDAFALQGIFDVPFDLAGDDGVGPGVASGAPQFHCRAIDLPAHPVGDALAFGGTSYVVRRAEPDGTGMTILYLEKTA